MNGLSALSILIVEDERIVAKDLKQALKSMGHDAFAIAASAKEALEHIQTRRPDLVLMDIRIRGARDGIETADVIRGRFGIPIIFLTAHADEATIERARKTEPFGYLLKPVKIPELRVAVELAAWKAKATKQDRERERWLITTLGCVPDPLLAIDDEGIVTFMSSAAERVLGLNRANAVGFPLSEILSVAESSSGAASAVEHSDLQRLSGLPSVFVGNGEARPRELVVMPADVLHDELRLGTVIVLRDVTDERERLRRIEEAERIETAMITIIGLANELNDPLAVLLCNASYAKEELESLQGELKAEGVPLPPAAAVRFERMARLGANDREAITRLQRAVRDLRRLDHEPAVGGERSSVSLAVRRAIRAMPESLRDRARIEMDLAEGLLVDLDSERLTTLLRSVTTNAFEAVGSPSSAPPEHVVRIVSRSDAGAAVIDVTDSGEGIGESIRGRVFDPFFTTRNVARGLGLTMGRRIASSSGGSLEIAGSRPGATTMRIRLPLATMVSPDGG